MMKKVYFKRDRHPALVGMFEKCSSPILVITEWDEDGEPHDRVYQNEIEIFEGDIAELYPCEHPQYKTVCAGYSSHRHEVHEICTECGETIEARFQESPEIGPQYDWIVQ